MKIKYSPHARIRLRERDISVAQVRLTLANSDSVGKVDRNRLIARKKLNGATLEVIYVVENNQIIIITLYYDKNIPKN